MNKFNLKEIKDSLIPNWQIPNNNFTFINNIKKKENTKYNNFKDYIINEFYKINKENDFTEDLSNDIIDKILELSTFGVQFVFSLIKINKNDVIFPICDIGKNRSQFMFYFLKYLQTFYNNQFTTGYPASGDELNTIIKESNSSILSAFQVSYKSDCFSISLIDLLGFEYSRSIHIFDKVLKDKEEYSLSDLKNFEIYKLKNHKYNIYDKNKSDTLFINDLFKKYFLNPENVKNILSNDTNNIIYLCLSPSSFIILCNLFHYLKLNDESLNLSNTKIIYFGLKDIFQRSSVNKKLLDDFIQKINSSISFIF